MNKFISIIIGLIILLASILIWDYNLAGFGNAFITLLKGGIFLLVILVGIALIFLGINNLKN